MRAYSTIAVLASCTWFAANSALFAQAPAAAPPTLWSFMGIPQTMKRMNSNLVNRRGNHPGLEKKPPLKKLADPENLKSPNPAIKKAAEIKQQEDLAKQKIKAIKYLASIGCGCYNLDGSITQALVAAMEDCTESVRLAAVQAIGEAADGEMCVNCKQKSCCSKEITEKLAEIAYERDDQGCWKEPSERVREAAIEALQSCCPGYEPSEEQPEMKRETPDQPESQEPARAEPTTTEENQDAPPTVIRRRVNGSEGGSDVGQSPQRAAVPVSSNANSSPTFGQRSLSDRSPEQGHASATDRRGTHISDLSGLKASDKAASPRTAAPALSELPEHLEVHAIDLRAQQVEVTYDSPIALPKGTRMHVYHAYLLTGDAIVGELEVLESRPGLATTRPVGRTRIHKLEVGDQVRVPR